LFKSLIDGAKVPQPENINVDVSQKMDLLCQRQEICLIFNQSKIVGVATYKIAAVGG